MAIRNLNFDSAVASCKTVSVQDAKVLHAAVGAKIEALGLERDGRKRSRVAAPVQKGNLNVRSILLWVDSVQAVASDASDEDKAAYEAACESLLVLEATLGMRL